MTFNQYVNTLAEEQVLPAVWDFIQDFKEDRKGHQNPHRKNMRFNSKQDLVNYLDTTEAIPEAILAGKMLWDMYDYIINDKVSDNLKPHPNTTGTYGLAIFKPGVTCAQTGINLGYMGTMDDDELDEETDQMIGIVYPGPGMPGTSDYFEIPYNQILMFNYAI
jgi:hypothetical protein